MARFLLALGLACSTATEALVATPPGRGQQQQQVQNNNNNNKNNNADPVEERRLQIFHALDLDGDGVITRAEYFTTLEDDEAYRQLFASEDKNEDDEVTLEEFDGPRGRRPGNTGAAAATVSAQASVGSQLASIDTMYFSHSLPVSLQQNVFAHIDTNKDVKLSFVEVQAYFSELQSTGSTDDLRSLKPAQEAKRVFEMDDADQDQTISYTEFSGPKVAHRVEEDSGNWVAKEDLTDPRTAGWGLGDE